MVVESGKVVWGSYSDGTFTPATDKTNATPYVELTLANSTANKIYIAVADLVNEHKAGNGISITNNTDGTRTIELSTSVNTKINNSVVNFVPGAANSVMGRKNTGDTTPVFKVDGNYIKLDTADDGTALVSFDKNTANDIVTTKSTANDNKANLDALIKRVDGIVATGGEANQDAYSNIKVGSTTLAATSKTDTVEFAGSGLISVAGSTTAGKKVTINHSNPTGAAVKASGFYKFATDAAGHATNLAAVAASDITALIGAHSLTLSKTNAANDTAAITIGGTSYTVGPIPLGDETDPANGTVRHILNN